MSEKSEGADPILIVPVPAFVAVLLNLEREKGAPLTEREVLSARDNAACIAMRRSHLDMIVATRGYDDIDMENAWEEWQAVRLSFDDLRDV